MRLIGALNDKRKALAFSQFLHQKGIVHQLEIQTNNDWGNPSYGVTHCEVWVEDEDQWEEISKWLQLFIENPENPFFHLSGSSMSMKSDALPPFSSPSSQTSPSPKSPSNLSAKQPPMGWATRALLGICTMLFFLSQLWTPSLQLPERYAGLVLLSSPVEKTLLYDYPKFYELMNRFLHLYGFEELENSTDLSSEGRFLLTQIHQTPYWPGYYQLILKGGWQAVKEGLHQYPTFEKIRQGQVWRFFTPILLHGDIFHLLFNMLWLILLGRQMEQRLNPARYLFFILFIAIISNTAQYLMSGPNFIGFSGVLCGMLAFIWVRQKKAAWEGYQIDRLTLIFMLIFVLSMIAIQVLSFVLEKSFNWAFSPNIANVAHLTGGAMGYLLGRLDFFSWRHT